VSWHPTVVVVVQEFIRLKYHHSHVLTRFITRWWWRYTGGGGGGFHPRRWCGTTGGGAGGTPMDPPGGAAKHGIGNKGWITCWLRCRTTFPSSSHWTRCGCGGCWDLRWRPTCVRHDFQAVPVRRRFTPVIRPCPLKAY
jgi:hypothetical protein